MCDCIEWTGAVDRDGYGRSNRKLVHRVAYEKAYGPIKAGLTIDHLCRNRRCINPLHFEAVTRRENTMRGIGPTALNARKSACVNGHPFNEANTYIGPDRDRQGRRTSRRQCRICNAAAVAAYKARKSA